MRLTHLNLLGPIKFKEPSFLGYQVLLTFFVGSVCDLFSIDTLDLRNLKPCHPDECLASFGKGLAFPNQQVFFRVKSPPLPSSSMCNLDSRDTTTPPYNENPCKSRNTTWDPHDTRCLSIFFGPWRSRQFPTCGPVVFFFLQAIWINRITHKNGGHLAFFFGWGGDIPCLNQTTKQSDRVSVSAWSSNGFT